ncbi:hypothetical protein KM043_012621 [Ampulex compressa]|nr:hypothetical protein KM043_012621 [Ampulex compressa]
MKGSRLHEVLVPKRRVVKIDVPWRLSRRFRGAHASNDDDLETRLISEAARDKARKPEEGSHGARLLDTLGQFSCPFIFHAHNSTASGVQWPGNEVVLPECASLRWSNPRHRRSRIFSASRSSHPIPVLD